MVVNAVQSVTSWLTTQVFFNDTVPMLLAKTPFWVIVLAQQVRETDLFGQVQGAWNVFVKTGQIWAFLIGIFLGYFLKAFTTFG